MQLQTPDSNWVILLSTQGVFHPNNKSLKFFFSLPFSWNYTFLIASVITNIIHPVCMCATSLQPWLRLCDPMDCSAPGSSVHGESPGKSTGVGCHVLLQGIFLTQGLNQSLLCLLHWLAGSLPLVPLGILGSSHSQVSCYTYTRTSNNNKNHKLVMMTIAKIYYVQGTRH